MRPIPTVPRNLAALALALPLTLLAPAAGAAPQAEKPASPPAAAAAGKAPMAEKKAAAPAAGARADLLAAIDDARDKLLSLAEAIPADKYGWRPGQGVRSVGEVYAHVASANYLLPSLWGRELGAEAAAARDLQKSATDKAKVVDVLRKSFAYADQAVAALSDADLDRQIDLFGEKGSVRAAVLVLVSHAHEHLGQSIAYARTNNIVPPWSAAEGRQGG